MFLEIEEMKSVLYEYQMSEIAENDSDIIEDGILAAIAEVRAYFEAANARRETASLTKQEYAAWKIYDTNAIFEATANERDNFVLRLCKRIASYNICELANVDVVYDNVKERYDNTIKTLEKIAGMGEYANSRIVLNNLPSVNGGQGESEHSEKPFRMVSRPKFNHE